MHNCSSFRHLFVIKYISSKWATLCVTAEWPVARHCISCDCGQYGYSKRAMFHLLVTYWGPSGTKTAMYIPKTYLCDIYMYICPNSNNLSNLNSNHLVRFKNTFQIHRSEHNAINPFYKIKLESKFISFIDFCSEAPQLLWWVILQMFHLWTLYGK